MWEEIERKRDEKARLKQKYREHYKKTLRLPLKSENVPTLQ